MLLAAGPIVLGPQTGFYDQPYVDVELLWEDPGQPDPVPVGLGPYGSAYGLGIYPYKRFLLDTAANAILSAREATNDLKSNGYQTEGTFREQGIGGWTEFDVSAAYRFDFQGTDGATHTLPQTADQVRILSSEYEELGGPIGFGGVAGLVGMPAMAGRVTTLDISAWADVTDIFELAPMEVTFSGTLPTEDGHRFSVTVDDRVWFDPADGLPPGSPPNAPLPTWAPLPFMTAVADFQGNQQAGNFLPDTGAQMSMISEGLAFAIGLDENGDGNFQNEMLYTVPIGGVGGTIEVPVLLIDKLSLPTQQGVDLVWTGTDPDDLGLEVLVLDIAEGIDGIFGVDLLTGGLTVDIDPVTFEIILEGAAYFDQIHFDFRNMIQEPPDATGTIYFDVHPYRTQITESGGSTQISEGGLADTYQVVLWAQPTANVTIELADTDGQLTAVDQASPANNFLVFTPSNWDTPQVVRVAAVDDGLMEGLHRGTIVHRAISADPRYDNIRIAMVTADIADNDVADIAARHIFYNNSAWDDSLEGGATAGRGFVPATAGRGFVRDDDDAIAPDKMALLPGETATFANYTSYARGINGIMIDIRDLKNPEGLSAADFAFKVGNDNNPGGWQPAAIVPTISVRPGEGIDGSDRVTIVFPDNEIENSWLEVTVQANDNTGLLQPDVFYFGNAIGETGNSTGDTIVNVQDILLSRNNPRPFWNPAPLEDNYDFDRDQRVSISDVLIARSNQTWSFTALKLIDLSQRKAAASEQSLVSTSAGKDLLPAVIWLDTSPAAARIAAVRAHDVVLQQAVGRESGNMTTSIGKLSWLYEFDEIAAERWLSRKEDPIETTVDKLLAEARTTTRPE